MPGDARPDQTLVTPEQARTLLARLPEGTHSLQDVATRWPDLLPAAMVLCDEATRGARPTTFHGHHGPTTLQRASARPPCPPETTRWPGEAFSIHVHTDRPVRVTVARPQPDTAG